MKNPFEALKGLRLTNIIAIFFLVAATVLVISSQLASRLFPRPPWDQEQESLDRAAQESGIRQTLLRLGALAGEDAYIDECRTNSEIWKAQQAKEVLFDCSRGRKIPSNGFLRPIKINIDGVKAYTAEVGARAADLGLNAPPPRPPAPPLALGIANGQMLEPPPRRFTPPIFFIKSFGDRDIVLIKSLEIKPTHHLYDPPMLFVTGVTLLLMAILVLVIRRLLTPLSEIETALEEYAKGNYAFRPRGSGTREFTLLKRSLSRMADQIGNHVQTKNRLLLDMGHELKTPLNRLRILVELAEQNPNELQSMREDIDEMSGLIHRILENARISDRTDALEKCPVDLENLVRSVLKRLQIFADRKKCLIRVEISKVERENNLSIIACESLLRVAFENLLENAIKYSPDVNGRVKVELIAHPQQVSVRISNNGDPIPTVEAERIFEPFYRLDSSRTKSTGGHGLGLSIAKRAALAHNGTLTLDISETTQTSFLFSIPRSSICNSV